MTLEFVITFLAMIFIGSLVMVGWFAITRGRIEYTASGRPFKTGKLFKAWSFFWTQGKTKAEFVEGKSLINVFIKLKERYKDLKMNHCNNQILTTDKTFIITLENDKEIVSQIAGAKMIMNDGRDGIMFKKDVVIYLFPEWVRDPLSECVYCFASIYGSLIYWSFAGLSTGLFDWSSNPSASRMAFWIFYCFGCAGLNGHLKNVFKL